MGLLPPTGLRTNQQYTRIADGDVQQTQAPVEPPAPATEAPSNVPGTRDSVESIDEARRRAAADAVLGNLSPQQRGIQAARTLDEVRTGIETRNIRLSGANREVQRLETRLGEQLGNLAPSLTQQQRQDYADAYRRQHSGAYTEARDAAQDLASYTRDNLPRVEQATRDLPGHPIQNAVSDMPARVTNAMQESVRQLDQAVRQSPTGSPELQRTLGELGQRFQEVSQRAGAGTNDPGNRQTPGFDSTRLTVGGTGIALGRLSSDVAALSTRAAGAFGVAGGVLGAADNLGRVANGTARGEHYVGAALNGAQVVGGVLRVAGVAIGGPVSLAAGALAIGAGVVSSVRDSRQYTADVTSTLREAGVDPARAEALARSNPESLRALQSAGYTPQQISDVVANAPSTTRIHQSQTEGMLRAAQQFGMTPAQMTDFVRQLGPERADIALNTMARVMSGNPGADRALVLREMQQGWEANAASRYAAQLLSR